MFHRNVRIAGLVVSGLVVAGATAPPKTVSSTLAPLVRILVESDDAAVAD